jgi:transcriptional repressor NrdR
MCNECKRRFTTYERIGSPQLKVLKRNDKVEAFDSDKLQAALSRVCRRRTTVTEADIRRIARNIEATLLDAGAKMVRSAQIVELALSRLEEVDRVSYNRLAANYIDEGGQLRTDPSTVTDEEAAQLGLFRGEEA